MTPAEDLIDRDIACGNGRIGKVTRQTGTWQSLTFGSSPTVNLWLDGEIYRHVRAVEGIDGLLETVVAMDEHRKDVA
jgi:hypothetical protein